jgi:hypothetical protein
MTKLSQIMATSLHKGVSNPATAASDGRESARIRKAMLTKTFPTLTHGASWIFPFIAQVDDGDLFALRTPVPV